MRVSVWNAYASNNSGSYTIIGRLPSAEIAERTAHELREVIDAHTAWRDAWNGETKLEESPLARFCNTHGLTWTEGDGGWNDWPDYGVDNRPRVTVSNVQVIVHHEYAAGLPPTFGALFYKRGGRVEHEVNHAHHPIVVTAGFYWPWTEKSRELQARELPRLLDDLTASEGFLATLSRPGVSPVWCLGGEAFGEMPLTAWAVFDELTTGVAALRKVATAHSAEMHIKLGESLSESDPLAEFRVGKSQGRTAR